jgi:hypothetical protein
MFDDNPVIVGDVDKKNKKQKILCVIDKVQLNQIEPLVYKCPKCKNTYQLWYEILEHEDDIESSHEDEADIIELSGLDSDSVGLLIKENELDFPTLDQEQEQHESDNKKGKIPIPKYFKDSETTKVIEYRETIEKE